MQTTTLPIQVSGATTGTALRQQQSSGDASLFSANLTREMALRQNATPAPAAIAPAPKAKAGDKPAAASQPPAAREPVKQQAADSKTAKAEEGSAKPAAESEETEVAELTPMADMLALVASFNQLQSAAAEVPAAVPVASAEQFAALQAGTRTLAAAAGEATLGAASLAAGIETDAAAGDVPQAALAAADKAQAQHGADFRAAQDAAGSAAAKAGPDAGELSARLAREASEAASIKEPAPVAASMVQAQPAVQDVAQAAATAAGDRLSARVGSAAWNQQVSQKIVWMVGGEEQTASLTLNPPDLGPLQVVLSISNDQTSVAFSSNELEVRQALENAMPKLREMMSESGIALGNATVDAGMPDGREAQQQQAARGNGNGNGGRGGSDAGAIETPAPTVRTRPIGDQGMVDTFA